MNQSIGEEWEKLFEGHCICDKYAPQEDIGCIIHGEDGIKAKKFLQSKISQALAAQRKELREKISKIPVVFINEDYNHEYVDTCDVYKVLSLLEEK